MFQINPLVRAAGTIYIQPHVFKNLECIKSHHCRIYILPTCNLPSNQEFLKNRKLYNHDKCYLEMCEIRKFDIDYILQNPYHFSKYLVENLKVKIKING